ncbi:hypothetical protein F8M41_021583 [Gigaspora margarita]|uniref:Uncharacterized protein n=1 Tax=Gigaspora margarita TaxID=4874 RepID=A0A8H4AGH0_GIGMA|nr:hypothetical protein F8M41_021583 [Gigaspora margarita]
MILVNTGKLSSEKLIPALNDIKNLKWLYNHCEREWLWNLIHVDDLNGLDVARKVVILSRITGMNLICNDSIDDEYTEYEAMLESNISTFLDMNLNYKVAKANGYGMFSFKIIYFETLIYSSCLTIVRNLIHVDDLNGLDVARKVVILGRITGMI